MNTTETISINHLHPFEGHPYKVQDNAEMDALVESIREHGILTPIIVRPIDGRDYEIISGHRRVYAAQKAGVTELPAFCVSLDRNAAAILLVDSNLHREHILPSEKAFAYKLKMDALKRQGKRTDLTSDQVGRKLETAEIIGGQTDESKNQVRRYIRLTNLIPELLQYVDNGKIAFTPAVELSYLSETEQRELLDAMALNDCTPSYSQAVRLKKTSQDYCLTAGCIQAIMSEPKANQVEHIRFTREDFKQYFPSRCSDEQMKKDILKGLELLKRQRERNRDAR